MLFSVRTYRAIGKCCALRLRFSAVEMQGSGLYRRSWTSLPTPFVVAQWLSELPLPCVTVCHHIWTGLYRILSAQWLSELPLPCVTVCHHIWTGLYRILSAQWLSELALPCVTVCHHIWTGLYRILSAQWLSERTVSVRISTEYLKKRESCGIWWKLQYLSISNFKFTFLASLEFLEIIWCVPLSPIKNRYSFFRTI